MDRPSLLSILPLYSEMTYSSLILLTYFLLHIQATNKSSSPMTDFNALLRACQNPRNIPSPGFSPPSLTVPSQSHLQPPLPVLYIFEILVSHSFNPKLSSLSYLPSLAYLSYSPISLNNEHIQLHFYLPVLWSRQWIFSYLLDISTRIFKKYLEFLV